MTPTITTLEKGKTYRWRGLGRPARIYQTQVMDIHIKRHKHFGLPIGKKYKAYELVTKIEPTGYPEQGTPYTVSPFTGTFAEHHSVIKGLLTKPLLDFDKEDNS